MNQLWEAVNAELQVEISKGVYLTFFKGLKLLSFENSVATIAAPSPIARDYIEKRYYALIKNILDKKTKENVSIIFTSQAKTGDKTKEREEGPLFVTRGEHRKKPSWIKAEYTFESLAVSDSNQLAYTAAQTVAGSLGKKYNPLFMYGSVGVGKTHLMHAIANKAFQDNTEAHILYLTTEEFTNEVVEAIRDKSTSQLRKKFRNTNLLLLDDIQFLSGKDKVQEELFHTFNSLIDHGNQVVFSSDRPPSEIKKIEARLASRFEGGLTVDIEPPDFELRTAILLIKAQKLGISLPIEHAKIAATRITNTRALEGFLMKLSTKILTTGEETTEALILSTLGEPKQDSSILHPDSVISTICSFYNIKPTQLKGVKRDAALVKPRHICMYFLKEEAQLTLNEVGNLLGGRDHTTVIHGVERVKAMLATPGRVKEEISQLRARIAGIN